MLFGLLRLRRIPVPTWKGFVLLAVACLVSVVVLGRGLYPFLAKSDSPEGKGILVADGWMSDRSMESIAKMFQSGDYDFLYSVGGDLPQGSFLVEYRNFAVLGERSLESLGLDEAKVIPAPSGDNHRHRTFFSAMALREALEKAGLLDRELVVMTEGPHARRTRMVYNKVFAKGPARIAVVSLPPLAYDMDNWWRTSSGMKAVVMETIAAIYEWVADSGR